MSHARSAGGGDWSIGDGLRKPCSGIVLKVRLSPAPPARRKERVMSLTDEQKRDSQRISELMWSNEGYRLFKEGKYKAPHEEIVANMDGYKKGFKQAWEEISDLRTKLAEAERKLEEAEASLMEISESYPDPIKFHDGDIEREIFYDKGDSSVGIPDGWAVNEENEETFSELKKRAIVAEAGEAALREAMKEIQEIAAHEDGQADDPQATDAIFRIAFRFASKPSPGAAIVGALEFSKHLCENVLAITDESPLRKIDIPMMRANLEQFCKLRETALGRE